MFSGGETSAYMVDYLVRNKQDQYNMWFIFCNTSKEREETLEFANMVDKEYDLNLHWLEATFDGKKGVGYRQTDFLRAKRDGEIFEEMIQAYGLPCKPYPHCTRELKTRPADKFCKEASSDFYRAIGIRADEIDRVSSNRKRDKIIYPLVSEYTTKTMVNKFWHEKPYRLNLKGYEGNCDMCWKKSNRKLLTLIQEKPELIKWWNEMEMKYKNYNPPHRKRDYKGGDITFFRGNNSSFDLIEMAKELKEPAKDDSIDYNVQTTLWGYDLDTSNGCEESCEAF